MATIQTAIALYDGVTSPLQSMTKAMNIVINSFESMQRSSGKAIDVSSIQTARQELTKVEIAFNSIDEAIDRANNSQKGFNSSIRDGTVAANGLSGKLGKMAATIGGLVGAKKVIEISDNLTNSKARLNNAMLVYDDGGSIGEMEKKVMASAQRSRSGYLDTVSSVAKLGMNAKDAFSSMDEVIGFQELINKQFIIGGASVQEQRASMLQLTQAMASGVLRGEELNSIFENAPGIIQNIADYLDVPIGQIRSMASEGLITADIVKNAMFAASDEIESKFDNMPMTWGQVWTAACNKVLQITQPLLNVINLLANNMDIVGPIILGVVGAFVAYNTVAAIANGLIQWQALLEAADAAAKMMVEGATFAAIAAQQGLNAALYACPLTWIIVGLIAIVALFYAGVAIINRFAGTSFSATGMIAGAFAVLGAYLLNKFVLPIWNKFAAIANFLGNVFHDPIAAIKILFLDMAIDVIGRIKNIANAIQTLINSIPGIELDITSGLENFHSKLKDAKEKVKNESEWVEYVKTMDYIDYDDAAKAGYKFGENLKDKLKGSLDFGLDMDSLYNSSAQTAENTAAMANAMEMSEEDLRYMRDIAEREAINRFTTAEVQIDMTGMTNRIDSNMDLDGVLTTLTDGFAEAIEVAAEGVHV